MKNYLKSAALLALFVFTTPASAITILHGSELESTPEVFTFSTSALPAPSGDGELYFRARDEVRRGYSVMTNEIDWQTTSEPVASDDHLVDQGRGCTLIYLDTANFQAPELYKSLGDIVSFEINDFPDDITIYWMRKELRPAPVR